MGSPSEEEKSDEELGKKVEDRRRLRSRSPRKRSRSRSEARRRSRDSPKAPDPFGSDNEDVNIETGGVDGEQNVLAGDDEDGGAEGDVEEEAGDGDAMAKEEELSPEDLAKLGQPSQEVEEEELKLIDPDGVITDIVEANPDDYYTAELVAAFVKNHDLEEAIKDDPTWTGSATTAWMLEARLQGEFAMSRPTNPADAFLDDNDRKHRIELGYYEQCSKELRDSLQSVLRFKTKFDFQMRVWFAPWIIQFVKERPALKANGASIAEWNRDNWIPKLWERFSDLAPWHEDRKLKGKALGRYIYVSPDLHRPALMLTDRPEIHQVVQRCRWSLRERSGTQGGRPQSFRQRCRRRHEARHEAGACHRAAPHLGPVGGWPRGCRGRHEGPPREARSRAWARRPLSYGPSGPPQSHPRRTLQEAAPEGTGILARGCERGCSEPVSSWSIPDSFDVADVETTEEP